MKKRFLALVLTLCCVLLPALTSCADDEDYVAKAKVEPVTLTLYGIKGEGTTDEAVKAVQDALNVYSEGTLIARVLLRLYTEDEYYEKLDEAFAKAEANKNANSGTAVASIEESKKNDDDQKNIYEVKFPEENGTQVDIFMVQGLEKYREYRSRGLSAEIVLKDTKSDLITEYVSERFIALTGIGEPTTGGNVAVNANRHYYGIPSNYIYSDYTYLLVNKEIANRYSYSASDVATLSGLNNFLNDANRDYSDYVTLYNAPVFDTFTVGNTLIGGVVNDEVNAYTSVTPSSLFADSEYVNYTKYLNLFANNGYIEEGDYYKLPDDKKVAAAFIKGNSTLPKEYSDDYIVVPYAKPYIEDVGTVFCVSRYSSRNARCVEVISALMTSPEYRNIFQYGVENEHYRVDSYTKEYEIISKDYNMDYDVTGNLFILKTHEGMSSELRSLFGDGKDPLKAWDAAKVQLRDTLVSPYIKFVPKFDENTGYDISAIKALSESLYTELMSYNSSMGITFEEHAAKVNATFLADQNVVKALDAENNNSIVGQYEKFTKSKSR